MNGTMSVFPLKKGFVTKYPDITQHIFPTKQEDVEKILEYVKNNKSIKRLYIFGSSTTWNCGQGSDIDISIETISDKYEDFLRIRKDLSVLVHSEVDLIHYNTIKSELLKSNISKGVCVICQ